MKCYIVAGSRPWNRLVFDEFLRHLPGQWHFVSSPAELSASLAQVARPRFIFFLHWSSRVPAEYHQQHECVCFHMTDVPYGRGGSPLQNLIIRGHRETKLTALRMVEELDAGPVYAKAPLSLEGSAEEIYLRADRLAVELIRKIVAEEMTPVPQSGVTVVFSRRKPEESLLPADSTELASLHDFIRMLDAEGYPKAFLDHGPFRFEFQRSSLHRGQIRAEVTITRRQDPD